MSSVLTPQSYHAARGPLSSSGRARGHARAVTNGRISSMDKTAPVVALLVEDGFDDHQLTGIIEGFATAQVDVVIIGPVAARSYNGRSGVASVTSELAPGTARGRTFAAVV